MNPCGRGKLLGIGVLGEMSTGLPMLPPSPQQVDVISLIKSHCYDIEVRKIGVSKAFKRIIGTNLTRQVLAPGPTGVFWFPSFTVQSISVTTGPPMVNVAVAATVV